ncbi:MAG: anaerobic ribonucleoside-triphosphate reductase activating protein [bacterium]
MIIGGLQKATLIDYPGKIACVVFTIGCNMRCGFCYNTKLVNPTHPIEEHMSVADFFKFLDKRKGLLDAVTVSGGEPTLHKDLGEFIAEIKKRGFLVKLDTQGSKPDHVRELLQQGNIDYVAMDVKAPLHRYSEVSNADHDTKLILESMEIIRTLAPDYEFRTTVVADQLDENDIHEIGKLVKGAKRHYLQKYVPSVTNDLTFLDRVPYDDTTMEELRNIMATYVTEAFVR